MTLLLRISLVERDEYLSISTDDLTKMNNLITLRYVICTDCVGAMPLEPVTSVQEW